MNYDPRKSIRQAMMIARREVTAPNKTSIKGQRHMLAYITPYEAELLARRGGSGRITEYGVPAFNDGDGAGNGGGDGSNDADGMGGGDAPGTPGTTDTPDTPDAPDQEQEQQQQAPTAQTQQTQTAPFGTQGFGQAPSAFGMGAIGTATGVPGAGAIGTAIGTAMDVEGLNAQLGMMGLEQNVDFDTALAHNMSLGALGKSATDQFGQTLGYDALAEAPMSAFSAPQGPPAPAADTANELDEYAVPPRRYADGGAVDDPTVQQALDMPRHFSRGGTEKISVIHATPNTFDEFKTPRERGSKSSSSEANWLWFGEHDNADELTDMFGHRVAEASINIKPHKINYKNYDRDSIYDPQIMEKILNDHKDKKAIEINGIALKEFGEPKTIYAVQDSSVLSRPQWRKDWDIPVESGANVSDLPRYADGGAASGRMNPRDLPGFHVRVPAGRVGRADGGPVQQPQDEDVRIDDPIMGYHGTPHEFERFDPSKIGTGEGAQAYGHGMYLAENEGVAQGYRNRLSNFPGGSWFKNALKDAQDWQKSDKLTDAQMWQLVENKLNNNLEQLQSRADLHPDVIAEGIDNINKGIQFAAKRRTTPGHMYEVAIHARPEEFLDWDAPWEKQSNHVKAALKNSGIIKSYNENLSDFSSPMATRNKNKRGGNIHAFLEHVHGDPESASNALSEIGIAGIRYFDADSRDSGKGTRNYVVFHPKHLEIKRRYADGGQVPPMNVGDDPTVQQALDITRNAQPAAPDMARQVQPMAMPVAQPSADDHPAWIPTRFVTSKKAVATPGQKDIVDLESMKQTPKLFQQNVDLVRNYPNTPTNMADAPHDEMADHFINHVTDNLLALHDAVPEEIRNRSKLWYDGARNIVDKWSGKYNLPDHSIAASLAALSPQKDWYQNVSLAERVLDAMRGQNGQFHDNFVFNKDMSDTFKRIVAFQKPDYENLLGVVNGKTLADLSRLNADDETKAAAKALWIRLHDETYNDRSHRIVTPEGGFGDFVKTMKGVPSGTGWGSLTEIGKAIRSIEAAKDPALISSLMGEKHKVRNFYNNILAPRSPHGDVTIDTHAVAAGLLRPLSGNSLEVAHNFANYAGKGVPGAAGSAITGIQGTYPLYAEAYRRAAQERGILPREMQSITWEAVRGLFPDTFKTEKNNARVNAVWSKFRDGEISQNDARGMINEIAGGIRNPSWFVEGRPGPNEIGQPSNEPRDISGSGLRGAPAEGIERGRGRKPSAAVSARAKGSRPPQQIEEVATGGSVVDRALRLTSNRPMVALADLFQRQLRGRPPS